MLTMRSLYAEALHRADGATINDLREAVTTIEDTERIARRVLGGAHPVTMGIQRSLHNARGALRTRETPLRFKVGSRVECCFGTDHWASGTVIKLWYTEDSFAQGFYAPYQVELDDGNLIFAPDDSDRCVRRAPPQAS